MGIALGSRFCGFIGVVVVQAAWHCRPAGAALLVEPLVVRVKFRVNNDQHFHGPDCAMAHAGPDQNGLTGGDIQATSIEFQLRRGAAFEDVIHLGKPSVVMFAGVDRYRGAMDRAGEVGDVGKSSASGPTGAWHRGQLTEIDQLITRLGGRL